MVTSSPSYDVLIAGAGIIGLAVAQELLQRQPQLRIAIVDKEPRAGIHASGRNSGVLHCGIFYGADTLKAKVCARGAARMRAFAQEHRIPLQQSGKLILATREAQIPSVEKLLKNAADNGIAAIRVAPSDVAQYEPYAAAAADAIFCPETAVIDSPAVVATLQQLLASRGVTFLFGHGVTGRAGEGVLRTTQGDVTYGYAFNCAGAYADRIAQHFGLASDYALVPFKGMYWKLSAEANPRLRANIYPVPDPALPFLGVHLTRGISGDVYVGPTAIPALGRENYQGLKGLRPREAVQMLSRLGSMYAHNQQNFRRLTHQELAKYRKRTFFAAAQALFPSLTPDEMLPSAKSGIRPQLINLKTHRLEMDYILEKTDNSLHILNTISPAFTSAFAFAEMIVDHSGVA